MSPKPGIEHRWSPKGRWRPPKASRHNLALPPAHFYFNGTATRKINVLPEHFQPHRTYSVYHDRAIFWTVDYDATEGLVGDGTAEEIETQRGFRHESAATSRVVDSLDESDDGNDDDDRAEKDDWDPLKFDHRERDRLSYAGRHQPFLRLCTQRPDQEWAQKLLTDACSAQDKTNDPALGGLIGELPLLIALAAFATPQAHLSEGLCQAIGHTWKAPEWPRTDGCKSQLAALISSQTKRM